MHILIVPTCLWVVFFFKIIYNIVPVFINCLLHVGLVPTEVLGVYFVNNSLNFFISQGIWNSLQAGKTQYISSLYSATWCQCRKPRDGIGKSNEGKKLSGSKLLIIHRNFSFQVGMEPLSKEFSSVVIIYFLFFLDLEEGVCNF